MCHPGGVARRRNPSQEREMHHGDEENRSPQDGRLVYVNSAASSLLGTDENFIEDWLSEAVPGFLESDVWRRILKENRSGECQTFALRAAIPDDQHKWCVHVSRNDDLWILMFIDENECRLMHAD